MWKCYFNIYILQHNVVWACGSVILIYIYYNTILWSMWKCYFNIYILQHNVVWACGSVILIYIYYNTIMCEHVEVLFQYWFITTQCCVSTSKCYFNIHLLQHNIVWACGSVILIYIYYNTILCEHVEVLF